MVHLCKKGNKKQSVYLVILLMLILTGISGCYKNLTGVMGQASEDNEVADKKSETIARYNGEKCKVISYAYTTKKELTLTFNGLGDEKMMNQLLDELDKFHIKAVFFLPGVRVVEEPEIAREILKRGHEIENNTLHKVDLTQLSYQDIYTEIHRSNEIIKKETGVTPKYISTKFAKYNDDILLAAAQCGLEAMITYSLNLQEWDMESAETIGKYVEKYIIRGGIIALDAEKTPQVVESIPLIAKAAADVGYSFVLLDKLLENSYEKKSLEEIDRYEVSYKYPDDEKIKYDIVKNIPTKKKEIALTFDDWGSDITITKILDILNNYDIKATFFLIGKGVEKNHNLAKAIAEAGHDVANHTYSHPVITEISQDELQKEVIKCHQVLTEAIQQPPKMIFRPPTGEINEATAEVVASCGYKTIALYDVTTYDWDVNNKADDIVNDILKNVSNGSIVLLHLLDNTSTVEALPVAIERLKAKGYSFVTMSQFLGR